MSPLRNQFGSSPRAVLGSSLILIALLIAGYCLQRIPYGVTVVLLLVLPTTVYLAMNTVDKAQGKQRQYMKLVMALSFAIAAVLAAIHFLHK